MLQLGYVLTVQDPSNRDVRLQHSWIEMKITLNQLRQIIKEELSLLNEGTFNVGMKVLVKPGVLMSPIHGTQEGTIVGVHNKGDSKQWPGVSYSVKLKNGSTTNVDADDIQPSP
jgi:hypothetical protein